jgi:uncharacterized protein YndB with AHSA1/START domain
VAHLEVDKEAPVIGVAEALVKAPIEMVWRILTNFESWPSWNKNVSKIHFDGGVKIGTSFVWVASGSKIFSRLEEVDVPNRLSWSGKTLGIRALHVWMFEKKDEGTHVYTEESLDGFIMRLFPGLMKKILTRRLNHSVMALKAEAESRHGSSRA